MSVVPPPPPPYQSPLPPSGPPNRPPPGRPRAPRRTGYAAAVLAGALVVGGGAGLGGAAAWTALSDDDTKPGGTSNSPINVVDTANRKAPSGSVEDVAATVLPSVAAIDVTVPGAGGGAAGGGSGVILSEDGLILTNDHVVTLGGQIAADDGRVTISFADGSTASGQVVGTDPLTDTALVQAEGVSGLTPVTVGQSGDLDVGEQVVAVGSPYGLDATVTSGIVSALDRPVEVARDAEGNVTAYPAIQTDAAINPGNSGGPLVNMDGQLVGINASIRTSGGTTGSETGSIGLGFAIPIDDVLPIVEQIRDGETPTHARLGIEISPAAGDDGAATGALIESVGDGSAASDAGLEEGDTITRVDDHVITDPESLIATVRSYRPGDKVEVTYLRDGDAQTTTLELGSDGD